MQSCNPTTDNDCTTTDNDCTTTDTYLNLPGGTTLTLSPTNPDPTKQTTYSLKNFHGDTAITANEQGLPTSSVFLYEPFGQQSPSATFTTNSNPTNATDQSMAWAANPTRKVEAAFTIPIIQMGARVYLPTTGRFLQVDPIEGGTANAYTYVNDPINMDDYSGQFGCSSLGFLKKACKSAVAYGHYLLARGKPKTYKASDFKWDTTDLRVHAQKLSNGVHNYGYLMLSNPAPLKVSTSASGFDGANIVGSATMNFTGTITVRDGSYTVKGTATFGDTYDFNRTWWRGTKADDRPWSKEFITWGGAVRGWPLGTNYENIFEGSIQIDETGTK